MLVKDLMSKQPIAVSEQTPITAAGKLMRDNDIGAVPVVDESSRVVGMVTDRDIVIRTIADQSNVTDPVKNIMTHEVTTIEEGMEVEEAIAVMSHQKIRRLPVTSNERLVGMLSVGDVAVSDDFIFEVSDMLYEISIPKKQGES